MKMQLDRKGLMAACSVMFLGVLSFRGVSADGNGGSTFPCVAIGLDSEL